MPLAHFVPGEAGCSFARRHGCTAVVVDALRASATASALLHAGANRILMTLEVEHAIEAHSLWPDALLYGERGGLPPTGFHHGNSPAEAAYAKGRDVIFTTTTGAGRMVQCWGAPCVLMGSVVNGSAVVRAIAREARDVVVIPAGLMNEPDYEAQEDMAAAAWLVHELAWQLGQGAEQCLEWRQRVAAEGVEQLFHRAAHAETLRTLNLGADITTCASIDLYSVLPAAMALHPLGIVCSHYS